jgi:hypothetical protein
VLSPDFCRYGQASHSSGPAWTTVFAGPQMGGDD